MERVVSSRGILGLALAGFLAAGGAFAQSTVTGPPPGSTPGTPFGTVPGGANPNPSIITTNPGASNPGVSSPGTASTTAGSTSSLGIPPVNNVNPSSVGPGLGNSSQIVGGMGATLSPPATTTNQAAGTVPAGTAAGGVTTGP